MADLSTSQPVSRAALLRGGWSAQPAALRPPWAREEHAFLNACTRCEACVAACPESVVALDQEGFPRLDFSGGECTFCGECVTACEPDALSLNRARTWCAHAEIQTSCLALEGVVCRLYEESCELRAIRFQPRPGVAPTPVVEVEVCNGCGACVAPCPAGAVEIKERKRT